MRGVSVQCIGNPLNLRGQCYHGGSVRSIRYKKAKFGFVTEIILCKENEGLLTISLYSEDEVIRDFSTTPFRFDFSLVSTKSIKGFTFLKTILFSMSQNFSLNSHGGYLHPLHID